MAPPSAPPELTAGEVSDLVELLSLVQGAPDLWHQRLYAQERTSTGGPGASLGEPLNVSDSDPFEVEKALCLRVGGPVDCLVRAHGKGQARAVTRYVRVTVGEIAARSYLQATRPAPSVPSTEAESLRAQLAAATARLEALSSAPTAASGSAWEMAFKLQEMQDRAFDRAAAMLRQATPPPPAAPSVPPGGSPELYQRLGRLEALQEVGTKAAGPSWVEAVPLILPVLERGLSVLDKMADARTAEGEARIAEALAKGDGAGLRLVSRTDAPAPPPEKAAADG
jgi:hypothetical protein